MVAGAEVKTCNLMRNGRGGGGAVPLCKRPEDWITGKKNLKPKRPSFTEWDKARKGETTGCKSTGESLEKPNVYSLELLSD